MPHHNTNMVLVQPQLDSLYYIHLSDGRNSVTVTPKLDGTNYDGWSRSMRRALGAKNKLIMVDHTIHVTNDDDDLNRLAWECCDHLVHSWIISCVSHYIAQMILYHDNVIEVWDDLNEKN
ncbi:unnamed protein product [Lathyrus sativus]|nr:unnamed protein product [Lathyrus sativus]